MTERHRFNKLIKPAMLCIPCLRRTIHTHTQAHALTQKCSCEFKAPPRAADGGRGGKPENERMDE